MKISDRLFEAKEYASTGYILLSLGEMNRCVSFIESLHGNDLPFLPKAKELLYNAGALEYYNDFDLAEKFIYDAIELICDSTQNLEQ